MELTLLATLLTVLVATSAIQPPDDTCDFLNVDDATRIYQMEVNRADQKVIRLNKETTYAVVGALSRWLGGDGKVTNEKIAGGVIYFYGRDKKFMFMSLDKNGNMCGMVIYPYHIFKRYIEPKLGVPL